MTKATSDTAGGPAWFGQRRIERWLLPALVVTLVVAAWLARWDQDDAFISYRYAANWLQGKGLVWNPGDPVEGYSNFLWVVVVAALGATGIDLPLASQLASVACFAGSLFATYALGRKLLGVPAYALLGTGLVGLNYSFFCYATGGLETQLAALIALVLVDLGTTSMSEEGGPHSLWRLLGCSVGAAAAVLTRPDGALIAGLVCGSVALALLTSRAPLQRRLLGLAVLALPAVSLVGVWLLWKLEYYGDWLPNTSYVKLGSRSAGTFVRGGLYVAFFFASYWLVLVLAFLAVRAIPHLRRLRSVGLRITPLKLVSLIVVFTLLYVVSTGGDIMEYRFLVPIIPLIYLLVLRAAMVVAQRFIPYLALVMLAGSLCHGLFFQEYVRPPGIGFVRGLEHSVSASDKTSWRHIGKALHAAFGSGSSVKVAVSPAGAIPYYSELPAVDILGLNDRWVARHGRRRQLCSVCTGHPKQATVEYLRSVGTNLLIGHPRIVYGDPKQVDEHAVVLSMFYDEEMDYANLGADARLLFVPLTADATVAMVYMVQNTEVDQAIVRNGWVTLPLDPSLFARR